MDTLWGIVISNKLVHPLNADSPISVTLLDIVTSVNSVHFLNILFGTFFTLSPIFTIEIGLPVNTS